MNNPADTLVDQACITTSEPPPNPLEERVKVLEESEMHWEISYQLVEEKYQEERKRRINAEKALETTHTNRIRQEARADAFEEVVAVLLTEMLERR